MPMPLYFLSCDWGTSSFRLRLVAWENRAVLREIREPAGVKTFQSQRPASRAAAFAEFLQLKTNECCAHSQLEETTLPIVISGMASSNVGWKELPYATLPFALDGSGLVYERLQLTHRPDQSPVFLLSGLRAENDIMRGEETELLGLSAQLAAQASQEQTWVILPGTHSKHVQVRNGAIADFHTQMTGELLEVLANHSLLKKSVCWPLHPFNPHDQTRTLAFCQGVDLAKSQGLGRALFRVRTRSILDPVPAETNGWFLTGLLIGAELAGVWAYPGRIMLAASPTHRPVYELALRHLGIGDRLQIISEPLLERAAVEAHAEFLSRVFKPTPRQDRAAPPIPEATSREGNSAL